VKRSLSQNAIYFFLLVTILIFANWGKPAETSGIWFLIYSYKWIITAIIALLFTLLLVLWFNLKWWKPLLVIIPVTILAFIFNNNPLISFSVAIVGFSVIINTSNEENQEWFTSSWKFAKQILPLLLIGVFIAGFLLGRPGEEGIIPSKWIISAVGGNSFKSNFFASIAGAFMYFATLTEVPILQGLVSNGMGKGPALALLLAGPALSLPNMLVIRSVLGTHKTIIYIMLVVVMATISGIIFGTIF
jgi:uncharacterized protein